MFMVFSFEKHDQQIIIFGPEVYAFSQCIFGPLGANGGPRGTTGDHGGQRGATPAPKKSRTNTNYSSTNAARTPQASLVWGIKHIKI